MTTNGDNKSGNNLKAIFVMLIMVVGSSLIADNARWSFKADRDSSEVLPVNGNAMNISVEKALGFNKEDGESINITRASMNATALTGEMVVVVVDELVIEIPVDSFEERGAGRFVHQNKENGLKVMFDFNNGNWNLSYANSTSRINAKDGLDIYLMIGETAGGTYLQSN